MFVRGTPDMDASPVEHLVALVYNSTGQTRTAFRPLAQTRHALPDLSDGHKIGVAAAHGTRGR